MLNWVQATGIALLLASPTLAHSTPRDITFTLQSDSSSALGRALLYKNQKDFGSNYELTLKVKVPAPGEAPLKDDSNRMYIKLVRGETHDRAQVTWNLGNSKVYSTAGQKTDLFFVEGEFAALMIDSVTDALKSEPSPLPKSSLWENSVECTQDGKCLQVITLRTGEVTAPDGLRLAQMFCARLSRKLATGETGIREEYCAYFNEFGKKSNVIPIKFKDSRTVAVRKEDLRSLSYIANLSKTIAEGPPLDEFQRLSLNRFEKDLGLRAFKNLTLAEEAATYSDALDFGTYEKDPRVVVAYNAAAPVVYPLLSLFPKYKKNIKSFIHMLTLIPDPDRWFLIAGLASVSWKVLPDNEFSETIPAHWRTLGSQVASYRKNNTIYVNQAFLDAQYFYPDALDTFENWLLFETLKIWIPETGDYDFDLFGQKFSRAITIGNLDEFRTKDARGQVGLTFMNFTDTITREIRATTPWPWNAANAMYGASTDSGPYEVRMVAPTLISEIGGNSTDTYSLLYDRSRPGNFDRKTKIKPSEVRLFCQNLGTRFPAKVKLTAQGAKFQISGTNFKWLGIEKLPEGEKTITLSDSNSCAITLNKAAQDLTIATGLKFIAGDQSE